MAVSKSRQAAAVLAIATVVIVAAGILSVAISPGRRDYSRHRSGIMGTEVSLKVVTSGGGKAGQAALEKAEVELRRVEAMMSRRMRSSQLSRLNRAAPGEPVKLSKELRDVLAASRRLWGETDGAFDVTCLPIFRVWSAAGKAGKLPAAADLTRARALSGWRHFRLTEAGASRAVEGAAIDLGGIAKGYGIDRAIEAIRRTGAAGGLVDAGGDVRCFGSAPKGGPWRVGVQDPFAPGKGIVLVLGVTDVAVATSGDYRRYSVIDGKRYSHIVDPRTARPVEGSASVTVVARDATTADAWATALSVLGPSGLKLARRRGLEVLMVRGTPERPIVLATPGFAKLIVEGAGPYRTPTTAPAAASRPVQTRP